MHVAVFRERPPRMVRDRLRSDKIDRSKESGVGNGADTNRSRDVFADGGQRSAGPRIDSRVDETGSLIRTERGYFGDRGPRRGGFRGRRMSRGGGFVDRSRFEAGSGAGTQNGFGGPAGAEEHSTGMADRVERNGFRALRDQRGRRGWRGRGGFRRPFPREHPLG